MKIGLNLPEIRAELARQSMPQWKLAAQIGMAPATLSGFMTRRLPATEDLVEKIEAALGLAAGSLTNPNVDAG